MSLAAARASWHAWSTRAVALLATRSTPQTTAVFQLVGMTLFVGLGAGSRFPRDAPMFAADAWWASVLGVAGVTSITITHLLAHRRLAGPSPTIVVGLAGNGLVYLALLVLFDRATNITSAAVMYGLLLFTCSAQAFQVRVTWREPWFLVPLAAALIAMASSGERGSIPYLVTLLFVVPSSVILGLNGALLDAAVEAEARAREEHQALLLTLRDRENAQLAEFLGRLAGRAHDLGGPALALEATIARLDAERASLPAEGQQLVDRARADVDALMAMVREAKDELRRAALPPLEDASLPAVARAVVARMETRFPTHAVKLSASELHVRIRGGEIALGRVLDNLIANACAAGKNVHVRCVDDGEQVRLVIEDDGPGLSPTYEPAPTRGLGSVRRLVETSGGTMEISVSRALGGAQVSVQLPRGSD